jgi:hypothetical protein
VVLGALQLAGNTRRWIRQERLHLFGQANPARVRRLERDVGVVVQQRDQTETIVRFPSESHRFVEGGEVDRTSRRG